MRTLEEKILVKLLDTYLHNIDELLEKLNAIFWKIGLLVGWYVLNLDNYDLLLMQSLPSIIVYLFIYHIWKIDYKLL